MEALSKAVEKNRRIRVHSHGTTSVASLLPAKRTHDTVALGVDSTRYLRIAKSGKTDLNGGRNGPWTEFRAVPTVDGELSLLGVKSGLWLTVSDGEFTSSEEAEPLLLNFATTEEPTITERAIENKDKADLYGKEINLQLADGSTTLTWPVRLERKGRHVFLVTEEENLACTPNGKFHKNGKNGQWAKWDLEETSTGISLRNVGHGKYLTVALDGTPQLSDTPIFFASLDGVAPAPAVLPVDPSALHASDVASFKSQGYVILRNAVPQELVRNALRCINNQLGKPDCWQADTDPLNAGQLTLNIAGRAFSQEIFNRSPVFWSAVNILLGEGNVKPWKAGVQCALRFPQPLGAGFDVPDVKPGTRYHIDGMGQNKLCPFSLLCGVALSDQTRPSMGNLHVFPGSHLHEDLHRYYREKINDDNQNETDDSKPDLGESVQVLLSPGDVVIAHQMLAHRVGVNTSEHIRYQLYYRVQHKDHKLLKETVIDNPWTEFAI